MIETNKVYKMEAIELLKQLPDNSVDLVLTDPPFGEKKVDKKIGVIQTKQEYLSFMKKCFIEFFRILKKEGSVYIHCDYKSDYLLRKELEEIGFTFQNNLVWCYRGGGHSKKRYARKHDNILFYTKSNVFTFNLLGKNIQYDYWTDINTQLSRCGFLGKKGENYILTPYQKPIELIKRIIEISSNEGDLVVDCFVGSGTTAVASKKLNRNFICSDINEEYVKIAESRLSETTPVDTLASPTFPTEKAINKDLTATQQVASPKFATQTLLNPDIKGNLNQVIK